MITVALLNEFVFMSVGLYLGIKFGPYIIKAIKFVRKRSDEIKEGFMEGYSK